MINPELDESCTICPIYCRYCIYTITEGIYIEQVITSSLDVLNEIFFHEI